MSLIHIHVLTFEIVQFSIDTFFNIFICAKGCLKNYASRNCHQSCNLKHKPHVEIKNASDNDILK
jgi:hypothetical protein